LPFKAFLSFIAFYSIIKKKRVFLAFLVLTNYLLIIGLDIGMFQKVSFNQITQRGWLYEEADDFVGGFVCYDVDLGGGGVYDNPKSELLRRAGEHDQGDRHPRQSDGGTLAGSDQSGAGLQRVVYRGYRRFEGAGGGYGDQIYPGHHNLRAVDRSGAGGYERYSRGYEGKLRLAQKYPPRS
jgi:hypothetical protein